MTALRRFQTETSDAPPWSNARAMLQEQLLFLSSEAAAEHMTDYEGADRAELTALVQRCLNVVIGSLEALDVVALLYGEDEAGDDGEDALSHIELVDSEVEFDPESVVDTIALARMGLWSRKRALLSLSLNESSVETLGAASGTLRTIQKSLSAVDRAISEAENLRPSIDFYASSVERSLEIRRLYTGLYRIVMQSGAPTSESLRVRLRFTESGIAQLLGLELSEHLRPADRAMLKMSHVKVRTWLNHNTSPEHLADGHHIWQDIANLVTLFLDVNKREELTLHDGKLAWRALLELPRLPQHWDLAAREHAYQLLQPMAGRSASLDSMLANRETLSLDALRLHLEEIGRKLYPKGEWMPFEGSPHSGLRAINRTSDAAGSSDWQALELDAPSSEW